jgi:DNA-binding transcriptional LysR family regulator
MLDAWALRVLTEVAEHGSFSAAAEALSMTQPAVSRQIAGLERRLGVRLFQRMPRGVRATSAGQIAIDLARDALARLQTIETRLAAVAAMEAGHLRLSAFPSANTFLVPEAIRRFRDAHPGVTLSLGATDQDDPVRAVRDGRIDLALVTGWQPAADADSVELIPLLDERLLLALPAHHPLARHPRVSLRDLRGEAWIEGAHPDCLGPVPQLADALGNPPRIGFTCDDWNGKQALVAAGAGVTLVPTLAREAIRADVALRATDPPLPARRLFAAAALPPYRPPAVSAMLTVLAAIAAHHRTDGDQHPRPATIRG